MVIYSLFMTPMGTQYVLSILEYYRLFGHPVRWNGGKTIIVFLVLFNDGLTDFCINWLTLYFEIIL